MWNPGTSSVDILGDDFDGLLEAGAVQQERRIVALVRCLLDVPDSGPRTAPQAVLDQICSARLAILHAVEQRDASGAPPAQPRPAWSSCQCDLLSLSRSRGNETTLDQALRQRFHTFQTASGCVSGFVLTLAQPP